MSAHRKPRITNIDNTGFGANSSVEGGRLTNKDGSTNLTKTGMYPWQRISIYHTLLRMKRRNFFFMVLFFYTCINLVFAVVYLTIGVKHLVGTDDANTAFEKFMAAFFFSSQTLTTVGYGHVSPSGLATNVVASIESLIGILAFAVVTGLIYGRFARPRAYIKFSHNILLSPYKEGTALMMRLATYKNNYLTDAEATVTMAMHEQDNGKVVTRFYQLPLEINRINSLALSWTLVHDINENSPLYSYTSEELKDTRFEVIVAVKAFDDHFSNIVQQRTSYTYHEMVYGARFLPMFQRAHDRSQTLLELDKLNAYEKVNLPQFRADLTGPETVMANA